MYVQWLLLRLTRKPPMNRLSTIILLAAMASGCSKESSNPSSDNTTGVSDAALFQLASRRSEFTPYKFSTDTLLRAPGSGHSEPKLRTLYNNHAATQLDGQGKVTASPVFPDSSLIVKELLNGDGSLSRIAVLLKLRTAANKDDNGWLWAEYGTDGSVLYSVDNKGAGCIHCHSAGVDYTRMNDSHP